MVVRQTTAAALTCCSYTMQGLWLVDNVFIELTCSIFKIRHMGWGGVGWGRDIKITYSQIFEYSLGNMKEYSTHEKPIRFSLNSKTINLSADEK